MELPEPQSETISEPLARLLAQLDLETVEENLFLGQSPNDGRERIFGGQVLGQAMMAALRTVEQRTAHSLHAYFLRPGDPRIPILFEVDRIRDGRSFATRRIVAIQKGQAIFNMSVSFQGEEAGPERQMDVESPGEPGGTLYEEEIQVIRERYAADVEADDRRFELPIEMRHEGGLGLFDRTPRDAEFRTWLRARGPLPDDLAIHQCVLAFASDFTISVGAVRPLDMGMGIDIQSASLDHAMWFHRPFRVDDWLLHVQDSPVTARARGLGRGTFYDREGRLVASCAQEVLVRVRE